MTLRSSACFALKMLSMVMWLTTMIESEQSEGSCIVAVPLSLEQDANNIAIAANGMIFFIINNIVVDIELTTIELKLFSMVELVD